MDNNNNASSPLAAKRDSEALPAKRDRATKNLQMALQGESPEHINRVLSLVIKFNIDPDEEFFLIIAAIGHLKVLVEDAPLEWQQLFESFQGELGQWATTNVEHLKLLAQKTQTIEHLANSCSRLANTLELLEAVSQEQTVQLKGLMNLSTELKGLRQELREIKGFENKTVYSNSVPTTKNGTLTWRDSLRYCIAVAFAFATFSNAVVSWSAVNLSKNTQIQVDWAMTKLGRIEKKLGISSKQK